ncbi:sortase B [Aequitasia blattaphilus]|uniref:Class B sortase n=1 Tax=Aequitasia blattaphilus TaxID=2949332 RepID=A0ABT1E8D8_9FIRM|nr:class B sortase [Aequitasia blattaphilus]MCP1101966.1 class B sortase [Aequitasia blattaphilus]MCR8614606.1 class B sortase [Aequitasia blattaphilus]
MSIGKKILIGIMIVCVVMAAYFGYAAFKEDKPYRDSEQKTEKVKEDFIASGDEKDSPLERQIDFKGLRDINVDIVGWIYIPGTGIDYPICQGTDNEYYLNHDFTKAFNPLGAIYMDFKEAADFSGLHTLVYGHYVNESQLFGELSKYNDPAFGKEHSSIYIYTPKQAIRYQIFSVETISSNNEIYNIQFKEETKEKYKEWIKDSIENALYKETVIPTETDKTLTLSTCTSEYSETSRFVVHSLGIEFKQQ